MCSLFNILIKIKQQLDLLFLDGLSVSVWIGFRIEKPGPDDYGVYRMSDMKNNNISCPQSGCSPITYVPQWFEDHGANANSENYGTGVIMNVIQRNWYTSGITSTIGHYACSTHNRTGMYSTPVIMITQWILITSWNL